MEQCTDIQKRLFDLQDVPYRRFMKNLLPELSQAQVIGVRTPALRRLAKELSATSAADAFLSALPHRYFEENQLHAFLLEQMKDFSQALFATEAFLPFIDNWATCDQFCPKCFGAHRDELKAKIPGWLASPHTYTVRFGLGCLMRFFLDADFSPEYLDWAIQAQRDAYYVRMMTAWFFATALAKQYDAALPVLQQQRLETWTHNKTIQKAVESYRISPEQKEVLRTLRIKKS